MRNSALLLSILAMAATVAIDPVPAYAQATRTWVSGVGDDANPCSRTAPCKTFAGAVSKTFINGEINCLDPGGFGSITITKSLTIDCSATFASILASGTTGVNISIPVNANDPTRTARLKGLTINGTGAQGAVGTRTGLNGVRLIQGTAVFIEDTTIAEFTQSAVSVDSTITGISLNMSNVTIRDTNLTGILLQAASGQVVASLNDVRIHGTPLAISAANRVRASLRNVTMNNNTNGIQTSGTDNIINADNIMVSFAATGVQSSAGSAVRLSNSMVVQNLTGLNPNGGAIVSFAGNTVAGNTTDGAFSATVNKQ
jgi:hypothetical protein